MELTQLLLTIIAISLFCLGWRTITDEGMLLGFIREAINKRLERMETYYGFFTLEERTSEPLIHYLFYPALNVCLWLAKPLILCITCLSSFWGFVVFVCIHGFSLHLLPFMVIAAISASFINTIAWKLYDK